ncbi:hypothetical protein KC363_g240 [Hortaea werneckii]|nr:hypothetical protein KC363_g240 [Hortaea werneckii]
MKFEGLVRADASVASGEVTREWWRARCLDDISFVDVADIQIFTVSIVVRCRSGHVMIIPLDSRCHPSNIPRILLIPKPSEVRLERSEQETPDPVQTGTKTPYDLEDFVVVRESCGAHILFECRSFERLSDGASQIFDCRATPHDQSCQAAQPWGLLRSFGLLALEGAFGPLPSRSSSCAVFVLEDSARIDRVGEGEAFLSMPSAGPKGFARLTPPAISYPSLPNDGPFPVNGRRSLTSFLAIGAQLSARADVDAGKVRSLARCRYIDLHECIWSTYGLAQVIEILRADNVDGSDRDDISFHLCRIASLLQKRSHLRGGESESWRLNCASKVTSVVMKARIGISLDLWRVLRCFVPFNYCIDGTTGGTSLRCFQRPVLTRTG